MTEQQIMTDIEAIMHQWSETDHVQQDNIFVVGCSTSEVVGEQIGTFGSNDVAAVLYEHIASFAKEKQAHIAFQCCEHLNRALVIERAVAEKYNYEVVSVVPQKDAGGSMATYAYQAMSQPVVVEHVQAHAGMDIGDTFIGMHLKHVAVPIRFDRNHIGQAHVTFAKTRPKLIGGPRAAYA